MSDALDRFGPPSIIGFCGHVYGPEFDENGHRMVLEKLRDEVELVSPESIVLNTDNCMSELRYTASFFYMIAGSIYTRPVETKIYRHSFEDKKYFFVSIGVSFDDLFLSKYQFRSVFINLILDATASLSQYAKRKSDCFDADTFTKCMTVACNKVLETRL